jgi:uncharacterized protein YihD (DUF1040 family)
MRDPKRIPKIIKKLREVWSNYPELRLCQLIINVTGIDDPYHIEDDYLLKLLDIYGKSGVARRAYEDNKSKL